MTHNHSSADSVEAYQLFDYAHTLWLIREGLGNPVNLARNILQRWPIEVKIEAPEAKPSRIERAKAIREEQQCSVQEAVRLERLESLIAEIDTAATVEDLKPILLSIIQYRHS